MSDASTPAELLARLQLLEHELGQVQRSARRHRAGLIAMVIAGATLLLAAAAPHAFPESFDVVRTKRLEIVDAQNKVVALASVGPEGGQIDLWNAGGANAARLAATARGGDLSIWSGTGQPSIGAFATDAGGRIEVYDSMGAPNGRMSASRDGGVLALVSSLGKPGVIALASDRGGSIAACDALGRALVDVSIEEGSGRLRVSDRTATPIALLHAGERGGSLEIADSAGNRAFSAGADVGGGSLTLIGVAGAPIVTAGATEGGGGAVDVRTPAGKIVVRNFVGDDNGGRFVVASEDGTPSVGAQAGPNGGILALLTAGRPVLRLEANTGGGRMEIADPMGQSAAALGVDGTTKTGALSIRNEKGQEIARVGGDEKGTGALSVYNRDGKDRKVFSLK